MIKQLFAKLINRPVAKMLETNEVDLGKANGDLRRAEAKLQRTRLKIFTLGIVSNNTYLKDKFTEEILRTFRGLDG